MKATALILFLLTAVGLAGTWIASSNSKATGKVNDADNVEPLPVETLVLQPITSFTRQREFTGVITAARRSRLAFERAARLESAKVDEGDKVEKGQVLAVIDRRQLVKQIAALNARRDQQAAVLAELRAGPRKETIAAAKADVQAMAADVELRKATLVRTQKLFDSRATSAQQLDEARLAWKAAVSRQAAAQKKVDELEAGTRQEQIDAQTALVAEIDVQRDQLQIDLTDSELKAPFSGTITKRLADEGDFLNSQQPVFELLESGKLEARIGIPSSLVETIREKEYLIVATEDREYTGHLKAIVRQVNPQTRTQTVLVHFDTDQEINLADGQLVRMPVDVTQSIAGFRVPLTALATAARGLWSVYVVEENESADHAGVVARAVEVLHTNSDFAIVQGDLSADDRIVVSGLHRIVPGQTVTWRNDSSTTAERE